MNNKREKVNLLSFGEKLCDTKAIRDARERLS